MLSVLLKSHRSCWKKLWVCGWMSAKSFLLLQIWKILSWATLGGKQFSLWLVLVRTNLTYCGQFQGHHLLIQEAYGERGERPAGDKDGQIHVATWRELGWPGQEGLKGGSNSSSSYLKTITRMMEPEFSLVFCNMRRASRKKLLIKWFTFRHQQFNSVAASFIALQMRSHTAPMTVKDLYLIIENFSWLLIDRDSKTWRDQASSHPATHFQQFDSHSVGQLFVSEDSIMSHVCSSYYYITSSLFHSSF